MRASIFCFAAVFVAVFANHLGFFVPDWLPSKIGADSVQSILAIIASSMLAVTTFSLTAMVGALVAATQNVTPRAGRLLMADKTTHNVLSTFLGAFLFSLVGLIALGAGAYNQQGRTVLFAATIIMITIIVGTLLRWIEHLSTFGRITDTTDRVEDAATKAIRQRRQIPYLGGVMRQRDLDLATAAMLGTPVNVTQYGYVQHVDVGLLDRLCKQTRAEVDIFCLPGSYVGPNQPVAVVTTAGISSDMQAEFARAFEIDDVRAFDQDPRFGLCVLTEIASRALSPAVNDPGTAIDVIGRHLRILAIWAEPQPTPDEPLSHRVRVPDLEINDLFDDAFRPIARDGAALVEIQLRLQKALVALARIGEERYRANAIRHSREAIVRASKTGMIESDLALIEAAAKAVDRAQALT
ncbi:DUF2254 domain-containing protein [Mesorhizobium sp. GR13]|uniref:DUF2254 domain-containing protein n=1 Tax=Mesorhizobium sp. GR13 TaxID=2562308 RepID=UPI001FEF3EBB|nr:DUF2254 domain-containing protein [Mesorhizobium sp. GR13]